jgi:hypothetical protein
VANVIYNIAKKQYSPDALAAATVKVLLIEGTTAPDPDHDTVAQVLAAAAEMSCTGYTPGAASASRKTTVVTAAVDDTNDRATATTAAVTFPGLDDGSTIRMYLYYVHTGTNDAANIPVACVDTISGLPKAVNGSDVEVGASTIRTT